MSSKFEGHTILKYTMKKIFCFKKIGSLWWLKPGDTSLLNPFCRRDTDDSETNPK
jgi:hypothetical protein